MTDWDEGKMTADTHRFCAEELLRKAEIIDRMRTALQIARNQVDRNAYGRTWTLERIDAALGDVSNARLIAAAPVNADLLEALEECLREHGGYTIRGECERRARAALKEDKR